VVRVSLEKGTNIFVFAVINGEGPSMIGSHLFPEEYPINPGFFLDTENSVETDDYIELNFYWYPTAIVKPRKKIYDNKPKCEDIKILDFSNSVVTQIIKKDIFFPLSINMHGRGNGIYKIESIWNNKKHIRSFYYCRNTKNLTPSEKWKIEMLKDNDFFSPDNLLKQMFGKNKNTKGYFASKRIHAYKSEFDNTLQPYVVVLPCEYEFTTGLPLLVSLRPYLISDKITFCKTQRYNYRDMIMLYPHSRGCSGYKGISEKDVLKVINLVCDEYKVDKDRIYLESGSFGASGNWLLGGRYPDLFAGVIADSGYDLTYANNFTALPIWQIWWKANEPGSYLPMIVRKMKNSGLDTKYTDIRNLSHKKYLEHMKNREKWLLSKKRNLQPDKVSYSTYGDIDGAYWVRNIMPEEKEKNNQCSNEEKIPLAPFKKGGMIQVRSENVASFSLDLRNGRFLKFKNWEIVIDDEIKTNAPSGEMFSFEFKTNAVASLDSKRGYDEKLVSSRSEELKKKNGFCGGICDVVCDSFIFAYSAKDRNAEKLARKFNYAITGIKANQFDGKFKVIPDTDLTKDICEKYNVILFTSKNEPGEFLVKNAGKLPVEIVGQTNSCIRLLEDNTPRPDIIPGHPSQEGNYQFAFVYPNPAASNRYLLTVTMTNFTPRILINEHNDVILGYRRGSFDKNWDKIQWQDEFNPHKHEHEHNHSCAECGNQENKESKEMILGENFPKKDEEKPWKKYGLIICLLGIAGFYTYDYVRNHQSRRK